MSTEQNMHQCLAFSLLILFSIVGCSGSGGNTTPLPPEGVPIVTIESPTPIAGTVGGWTRLRASASNAPTAWLWEIGSAGSVAVPSQSPRARWSTAGTHKIMASAVNDIGASLPIELNVTIAAQPVAPVWSKAELETLPYSPAIAVAASDDAIVLAVPDNNSTSGQVMYVGQIDPGTGAITWNSFQDASATRLPRAIPYAEIQYRSGTWFFCGRDQFNGLSLSWSDKPVPFTAEDWHSSSFFEDTTTGGPGASTGRLAFVNEKPIVIGAVPFSLGPLGVDSYVFTMWSAIADSPTPSGDGAWTQTRLPDLTATSRDTRDELRQVASGTPDGGVAFVQRERSSLRLRYFHAADEAAVRANQWSEDTIGPRQVGQGEPYAMLTRGNDIVIAFDPIYTTEPNRLGFAISGDPSGLVANWRLHFLEGLRPLMAAPPSSFIPSVQPMQLWGDRLVMVAASEDGIALARELTPGATTAAGWQTQLIAPRSELGAPFPAEFAAAEQRYFVGLATTELDCYVPYLRQGVTFLGPTNPLTIATADGSW